MSEKKSPILEAVPEIDTDQLLLQSRILMLDGIIDINVTKTICGQLLGLNAFNHDPIELRINSPGGSVPCGFAIIDTIFDLQAPVYTYLCGTASSMGAMVFLAGSKRAITGNSSWMIHGLVTGCYPDGEYFAKIEARMKQDWTVRNKSICDFIKERTKLRMSEIRKAMQTELHLWPEEALARGVAHAIVGKRRNK